MYGFRTRTPILRFFCTCSVPVLAFENHYVPVPFTHQYFIFNPYPFRPRTWFFKTNPYPYQCRLVLLRFRTPYPYPYLKYQGNYSSRRNKYIFETAYQKLWISQHFLQQICLFIWNICVCHISSVTGMSKNYNIIILYKFDFEWKSFCFFTLLDWNTNFSRRF